MSSSTTPILGLSQFTATDKFSFADLNRDNMALETLLAALVVNKTVVLQSARSNAYNVMNIIRNSSESMINKAGVLTGYYTTPAATTSSGIMYRDNRYLFGYDQVTSFNVHSAGDVSAVAIGSRESHTWTTISPLTGYINSVAFDGSGSVDLGSTEDSALLDVEIYKDDTLIGTAHSGSISSVRAVCTIMFDTPISVNAGDELEIRAVNPTVPTVGTYGSYGTTVVMYGSGYHEPLMTFGTSPAPRSGYLTTALNDLREFGHTEANAYILANAASADTITVTLTDENGAQTQLTASGSIPAESTDGEACKEFRFVGSYSATKAKLTIGVTAGSGSNNIEVFGYGVTFI